ncbi:MAG: type II 3-dehydroquinate dehydratase, partial [Alphaproteobacteria bacterium]
MSFDLLVLNGPNLNLLGQREPEHYGAETLDDIARRTGRRAAELGAEVTFRQSNDEAELIGWIQDSRNRFDGLVVNAGAFTHTSLAILDALQSFDGPIVEVHLSNIFRRSE